MSVRISWTSLSSVRLALGLQGGKLGVIPTYVADTSHSKWAPSKLEYACLSFYYDRNVPFNVCRHPAFVEAVNATASAGFNYKPPSYNALQITLIESKKMEVEVEVKKATSFSIETYGVSLCSNGWDNVVHRPLMNINTIFVTMRQLEVSF